MSEATLFGDTVYSIDRCPQCGVASPLLSIVAKPVLHFSDQYKAWWFFTAKCSRCLKQVLFYGHNFNSTSPDDVVVTEMYPSIETVDCAIPDRAKRFLQQALESLHAPDGAIMLAASSIDAMLKENGYKDGSLYGRIEKAALDSLLTKQMSEWAHEIRLGANEPRHADEDFEGATRADADQAIQFARALGEYLFVLPARVMKWKQSAKAAG